MNKPALSGYRIFQNPLGYVAAITCLAVLTAYFHLWWWLTGGVALVWGLWLIRQSLSQDQGEFAGAEQLQGWLDHALLYQFQINQALSLNSNKSGLLYRQTLANRVNTWTELIRDLVQRLANLRGDDLIHRELMAVPKAIESLEAQLAATTDPALRAQLEQALARRHTQLAGLKGLQSTMRQAEIQIENTLSLLSTLYSQVLTGQSVNHIADYERFVANLDEEVGRLQDHLEALQEVKNLRRPDLP